MPGTDAQKLIVGVGGRDHRVWSQVSLGVHRRAPDDHVAVLGQVFRVVPSERLHGPKGAVARKLTDLPDGHLGGGCEGAVELRDVPGALAAEDEHGPEVTAVGQGGPEVRQQARRINPSTMVRRVQALGLRHHRQHVVGPAAREAGLALAFLNGTPYERAEATMLTGPDFTAIARSAERFGPVRHPDEGYSDFRQRVEEFKLRLSEWVAAGKAHVCAAGPAARVRRLGVPLAVAERWFAAYAPPATAAVSVKAPELAEVVGA